MEPTSEWWHWVGFVVLSYKLLSCAFRPLRRPNVGDEWIEIVLDNLTAIALGVFAWKIWG